MDGDDTNDEGRTGTSQRKTVERTAWRWSQHVATTWYACTAKGSVQRNRMKPCGRLPCAAPLAANNLTHVLHGRGRTGLHDLGHASLRAQLRLTPSSGRNLLHALSRPPGRPTPPAVTTLHNCFQWHQFASQCSHVRSPAARPWPHRHRCHGGTGCRRPGGGLAQARRVGEFLPGPDSATHNALRTPSAAKHSVLRTPFRRRSGCAEPFAALALSSPRCPCEDCPVCTSRTVTPRAR